MSIEKRGKKFLSRIYKHGSKSFDTEKEAKAHERQINNFRKNKIDSNVSHRALLDTVFNKYIQNANYSKKDQTIRSYKSNYNKWIKPNLGSIQIGNINHITLTRFVEMIKNKGASDYVANYSLIVLKEVFKYATNSLERFISVNPMETFEVPRIQYNPEKIKYWTSKEAERVLTCATGSHYYLLISAMLNTGLRSSEAIALRPKDIDFNLGVLRISSQLIIFEHKENEPKFEKKILILEKTKNSSVRIVPLNRNATNTFQLALQKSEGGYFVFEGPTNKTSEVITKRGSRPTIVTAKIVGKRNLNLVISELAKKAGVDDIGPHGLRHTFAANFLMNGGDVFTLSKILGHKSINSTLIYSHLTDSYLKSAMSIVEFGG